MNVLQATIQLSKASMRVVRRNPRLALFPLLAIALSLLLLLVAIPLLPRTGALHIALYILGISFALVFIGTYFEAALVRESLRCLRGESPRIRAGLSESSCHARAIAVYSLISMTVGAVLAALGRTSRAGQWLAREMVSTGWSLVTFFALPVMVQERRGGVDSLVRSGQLFRESWGETTLAEVGLRPLISRLSMIMLLLLLWLASLLGDSPLLLVIAAAAWIGLMSLVGALGAVYRSAMYIFAAEGVIPEPFNDDALDQIWRVK